MRLPPSWFVHKLKALNPNFSIVWDETQRVWAIKEAVRFSRLETSYEGAPVYRMHRRPETALRFAGVGSRLLDYVRRNDPRKYKSVEQMIKKLRIDDAPRPQIPGMMATG